ncbi:hypothetical protein Agub_g6694, partial [Astrephomene gubernaculifera]
SPAGGLHGGSGGGAALVGEALRSRLRAHCLGLARRLPAGGEAAPAARRAATDALRLALQLQLPVEELLEAVMPQQVAGAAAEAGAAVAGQGADTAAAAAAAGAVFYENFKAIVNRAFLFHAD